MDKKLKAYMVLAHYPDKIQELHGDSTLKAEDLAILIPEAKALVAKIKIAFHGTSLKEGIEVKQAQINAEEVVNWLVEAVKEMKGEE